MPARAAYAQGTPNWVDLQTPDVAAGKAFYGPLFDWTFDDVVDSAGRRLAVARKRDGVVAAIGPVLPRAHDHAHDQHAHDIAAARWNTYLAVDDVGAALTRVKAAGGSVLAPATDVDDAGVLAVVRDVGGAVVHLWQAGAKIGATIVNEPGAVIWNELTTDDLHGAVAFYKRVFRLAGEVGDPGGGPYVTFKVKGEPVAGACPRGGTGAPSHWHVYFAVDDAARAAARAVELGGDVLAGPMPTAIGPMAALRDSLGAMFSVFEVPADPLLSTGA